MNRQRSPETKLRLRHVKRISDDRKEKQRDGVEDENSSQGYGHLFFAGIRNRADGRDSAASANGRTSADEEGRFLSDMNEVAKSETQQHRRRDAGGRVEEARASGLENLMKVHAKAEGNDRSLQQKFRQALAFDVKGVRYCESVDQTAKKRDGRRNQTACCQDECHEKCVLAHEESVVGTKDQRPSNNFD